MSKKEMVEKFKKTEIYNLIESIWDEETVEMIIKELADTSNKPIKDDNNGEPTKDE
tara:strand:+ start:188 stop:355 length:168 start_codon:yes stop_codon:yes gene_type:complete